LVIFLLVFAVACTEFDLPSQSNAAGDEPWLGAYVGESDTLSVSLALYPSPACSLMIEDSKYGYSVSCYYALFSNQVGVMADMRVFPDNVVRSLEFYFSWDAGDLLFGELRLSRQGDDP